MNEPNEKKFSFLFFDDKDDQNTDNLPEDNASKKTENEILRKTINFWKTGIQKYKITLVGELQINSMNTTSKVENNLIFHLKNIFDDGEILLNLISYDKEMISCNNQGFKEMFLVTRQLEKLYDEFEAVINQSGEIIEIKNLDFLQQKWKKIKNELVTYFNEGTDIESFFKLNDETMNNQSFWKQMLNEQEFFFLFFDLANYGHSFQRRKQIKRDNAFRSNQINWQMDYEAKTNSDGITMSVNGFFKPDNKWLDQAYGKMPFLTGIPFTPNFKIEGEYKFDPVTGFIKEAYVNLEETVNSSLLYHKLKFQIIQMP